MARPQPQNQVVSPFTSKPMVVAKTSTTPRTVQRHTYTSMSVVLIHTSEQQQAFHQPHGSIIPLMVA